MNWTLLTPEIILTCAGVLVMLTDAFLTPKASRTVLAWLAAIAALAAMSASVWQLHLPPASAYFGAVHVDAFSSYFHVLLAAILLCGVLLTPGYLRGRAHTGEYYSLLLFAATGMMLMTSAASLLLVFIGLEISSISSYILTGFRKQAATGPEAAIKYFLLGSFATAFFLYGVALAFGATGSDNIYSIGTALASGQAGRLAIAAMAMMLIGLGFKVSAAPFHVWTPDVYEGAPTPVTGFMSTGPKAAVFAVLLRLLDVSFAPLQHDWMPLVWLLAVLSMTIGNLGALRQTSVKRMLAYSSIAHAGYTLAALATGTQEGAAAASFYMVAYAAMNMGAFAVLAQVSGYDERANQLRDFAGLARRSPYLAAMFSFFLLSLIGIPFTGGFFGKFYAFTAVLHSGFLWLAVIGLANSGIGAYYYLRVIGAMYMQAPEPGSTAEARPLSFGTAMVLVFAAAATFVLGVLPGHTLVSAQNAAADLRDMRPISPPVLASR